MNIQKNNNIKMKNEKCLCKYTTSERVFVQWVKKPISH